MRCHLDRANATEAVVFFDDGVELTFRCPGQSAPIAPNLTEVARMQQRSRLDEPISIPEARYREAAIMAAGAIGDFRRKTGPKQFEFGTVH